jgi:hypothetical protein
MGANRKQRSVCRGLIELTKAEDWAGLYPGTFKSGYSAKSLAFAWGDAKAFPPVVQNLLNTDPVYKAMVPKFAIAEQVVFLDTLSAPSETDLMVYCEDRAGRRAVLAVEGKVNEPFASRVWRWIRGVDDNRIPNADARGSKIQPGRARRLNFLNRVLGANVASESTIRYQLMHRAASAILEANRIGAQEALMLVHSFHASGENWDDFCEFVLLFVPRTVARRQLVSTARPESDAERRISFGWAEEHGYSGA